jgi:hypothetical protein
VGAGIREASVDRRRMEGDVEEKDRRGICGAELLS